MSQEPTDIESSSWRNISRTSKINAIKALRTSKNKDHPRPDDPQYMSLIEAKSIVEDYMFKHNIKEINK